MYIYTHIQYIYVWLYNIYIYVVIDMDQQLQRTLSTQFQLKEEKFRFRSCYFCQIHPTFTLLFLATSRRWKPAQSCCDRCEHIPLAARPPPWEDPGSRVRASEKQSNVGQGWSWLVLWSWWCAWMKMHENAVSLMTDWCCWSGWGGRTTPANEARPASNGHLG